MTKLEALKENQIAQIYEDWIVRRLNQSIEDESELNHFLFCMAFACELKNLWPEMKVRDAFWDGHEYVGEEMSGSYSDAKELAIQYERDFGEEEQEA